MKQAARWILPSLLAIALIVRLVHWPALHEVRDSDELGYAWGSLQLLEGNLPAIHYAPAGPQTWLGWAAGGCVFLKHLAFPDRHAAGMPPQLRPFVAMDRTLFDAYRDLGPLRQFWILVSFACSIGGVIGFYRLGLIISGAAGAIFAGGTVALLPLFVEFSVQARPYIVAWSFGIITLLLSFASARPNARRFGAIFMGLAIGSRVDMAMLLPVVWSVLWAAEPRETRLRAFMEYHVITILTFLVVAPWYLMTLLAGLRAIGTIRASTTGLVITAPLTMFRQAVWEQGMFVHVPLFLLGVGVLFFKHPRRPLLGLYLLLVGYSIFKGAAFGFRYQGAPIILATLCGLWGLTILQRYSAIVALGTSVVALALPLVQTTQMVAKTREEYVQDDATRWVEQHVQPGSIVYIRPWISNLLPTREASEAGWTETSAATAYERKFRSGLQRFDLNASDVPRALSEVNLALERGNRRFLFILGGHESLDEPRYDTRVFQTGPAFGVRDLPATFKQTGGVVILRGPAYDPLVSSLGMKPTIAWLGRSGEGTRVYCSPDLIARLK
jgi:hypothetical protein